MSQNVSNSSGFSPDTTICQNCHSPMPLGLRFCRNCGFRLGEGVAEYTETVRFADRQQAQMPGQAQPLTTTYGLNNAVAGVSGAPLKRRKRMTGMTWMFVGLLLFFVAAAAFTAIVSPGRGPELPVVIKTPRSYAGFNGLDTTEGGVTFQDVEPPGSPADKAGLIGGDIITSFDGHEIKQDDDVRNLLETIPPGKTVDVVYIRDGETKTTKLTTIARDEFERLGTAFVKRPEGRGRFGFDDDATERVEIPGTKTFGIRLDEITPNLPADLAGVKEGDIVIEFDGTPIRTTGELVSRVKRAIPYSTVNVVVMRGSERLEIPVKMGRQ